MTKIRYLFVVGILIIPGLVSIPIHAGPALEPLTIADANIIDMIYQVNESLLYYYNTHLTAFGPRATGTENSMKASQYIYDEFHAMGLAVEYHNWTYQQFSDRNVVATLPGADPSSNATFIISAHHDTVSVSPGADDDASGVAAVLATAKILSQYTFQYTIRFITFSGEEKGLDGSYLYARDAYQREDNIVAVINLDTIGFANTTEGGRTLLFFYTERSKWIGDFAQTVSRLYKNQTNMSVDLWLGSSKSDQQSFVEYGFDAILMLEYDWRYSLENTPDDTTDRLNWTYLTKATKLCLAVVGELASTPIELQVIITKPYEGFFYFFNYPLSRLVFKNIGRVLGLRGTTVILGTANVNVNVTPYTDIKYVLFGIDGYIMYVRYGAAPQYEWKNLRYYSHIGRYDLEIYAYDTSGRVASDEMNYILI